MKRIISVSLISLILALLTGCVTYGPRAKSETTHGALSETVVVAAIGGFRGINKDKKENAFLKEARDHLLNEHTSITVWQVPF